MRLDCNSNEKHIGKYALIKMRNVLATIDPNDPFQRINPEVKKALDLLEQAGILDYGHREDTAFFVMRFRDIFARPALFTYADAAKSFDPEYAGEVKTLAENSGWNNSFAKVPD